MSALAVCRPPPEEWDDGGGWPVCGEREIAATGPSPLPLVDLAYEAHSLSAACSSEVAALGRQVASFIEGAGGGAVDDFCAAGGDPATALALVLLDWRDEAGLWALVRDDLPLWARLEVSRTRGGAAASAAEFESALHREVARLEHGLT